MPWSKNNYPSSFKNVSEEVRNKAIEISNALLRENYDEQRAIRIGLSQARETIEGQAVDRPHYEVHSRKEDWILTKKGSTSAIYSEPAKDALLQKAKPYVNEHDGILTVFHEDDTKEETLYD